MKTFLTTLAIVITLSSNYLFSAIRIVPVDYSTIQAAINAATHGDTVLLYNKQTYTENINFNSKRIVLASRYLTTADTSYISGTIINGNNNGSCIIVTGTTDTTAKIIGLTIKGGNGNVDDNGRGGGIYTNNTKLIIRHCRIVDNSSGDGGGIFIGNFSNVTIQNTEISGNQTGSNKLGGGICVDNSFLYAYNCLIQSNGTGNPTIGAGINASSSSIEIIKCKISKNGASNLAGQEGGGIRLISTSGLLDSLDIIENRRYYGGGIIVKAGGSPSITIKNSKVFANSASYGGGIYSETNLTIDNCEIDSNSSTGQGGGIVAYGAINVKNSKIFKNIAGGEGGGIFSAQGGTTIENTKIYLNKGGSYGGGFYGHGIIRYCEIYENETSSGGYGGGVSLWGNNSMHHCIVYNNKANYGGGVGMFNHTLNMRNCKIYNNTATINGGGVYVAGHPNTTASKLYNNTIVNNTVINGSGNGVYFGGANNEMYNCIVANNSGGNYGVAGVSTTTIKNNLVYGNTGGSFNGVGADKGVLTTVNINGDSCDTHNNILLSPQFVSLDSNNFRLTNNSPAIEAGNNSYNSDAYDLDGDDRIQDGNDSLSGAYIDMGAYEYGASNKGPTAPVGLEPSSNQKQVALKAVLLWNRSKYATGFDLEVSTSILFSTLVHSSYNTSDSTYTCTNLEESTKYYWRIRAKNANGNSDWNVYSFTTGLGGSGGGSVISKNVKTKQILNGLWLNNKHLPGEVSIELRSGSTLMSSTVSKRIAATIDTNGFAQANFGELTDGNYWLVIRASGYLPVANPTQISLSTSGVEYDFTSSSDNSVAGANAMIQVGGSGPWMIRGGDFNNSRSVTAADVNSFFLPNNGKNVSTSIPAP